MKLNPPEYVLSVKPYVPGKPIEELKREIGIDDPVKLASNENPLGPSPLALKAITEAAGNLHRYPDGSGYYLVRKIAETLGVRAENVILGNGSDDIIGMLARALLRPGDQVIMAEPSFSMYAIMTRLSDAEPVFVPLNNLAVDLEAILAAVSPRTRMIFLTNPNNPTGTAFSGKQLQDFLKRVPPEVIVVMDEAYIEFSDKTICADSLDFFDNNRALVTLRTFSKAYGLAGLRIGYGIMPDELVNLLNRVRQPFNVNALAQAAGIKALDDTAFLNKSRQVVREGLKFLLSALKDLDVTCFPTQANFFLVDVKTDAETLFQKLLSRGVIVRSMVSYGYPTYLRITAGLPEENERFLQALKAELP